MSPQFVADLKKGLLAPILSRVQRDATLCLEVREDYCNIYYRGGNLLRLTEVPGGYETFFDRNYDTCGLVPASPANGTISKSADVADWIGVFPLMKQAIDLNLGDGHAERDFQQLLVRDNNFSPVANATDYFICDIEYEPPGFRKRFDFIAIHWRSKPNERKKKSGMRLVIGEIKYGDKKLRSSSGLVAHANHVDSFLGSPGNAKALNDEMRDAFNQKRELGLVPSCGHDVITFGDERPVLMFVLANHDPDSKILDTELAILRKHPPKNCEVVIAQGNLFGCGLYDEAMIPLSNAKHVLGTRLKS